VKGVDRERLGGDQGVAEAVAAFEAELGDTGRVLLRPSGTEPVVRVMVEAADQHTADRVAHALADVVRERLAL
jgi:phosphoglucosamine mutase